MRAVNRAALLVKPKQAYLDWAASLDDAAGPAATELEDHMGVYLVSDPETVDDLHPDLTPYYEEIFWHELESWSLAIEQWPAKRDFKTFLEWFEVTAQTVVFDLGEDMIEVDDPGEL